MGKILIVDPSLVDRKRMRSVVEAAGHTAIEMSGPAQATRDLSVLAKGAVDLILTELQFPDASGPEFIRWVKGQAQLQAIPILIVTPQPPREQVIEMVTAGASTIITKPFGGDLLLRRVTESLVEQASLRQGPGGSLSWQIDDYLRRELKRSVRSGSSYSIMLCRVLPPTAIKVVPALMGALVQVMRESDVLVRHGENQVVILLPDTDAKGATVVERKVSRAAVGLVDETSAGTTSQVKVVMGAATFPSEVATVESMLALSRERCDMQAKVAFPEGE